MTIHHLIGDLDLDSVTSPASVTESIPPITVDAHDVNFGDVIAGIGCEASVGMITTNGIWWSYFTDTGVYICRRLGGALVQVIR